MCVDVAKTARVTGMRVMPKLQAVFWGTFFGFAVTGRADSAMCLSSKRGANQSCIRARSEDGSEAV